MTQYNGHRSWSAWNVAMWIASDEGLYRLADDLVRRYGATRAANILARELAGQQTPDGAKYNRTCVREALRDWRQ